MAKAATIYDVAKKAGVSVATVSRVMNGPSRVASGTREAVQNAIRELHFEPKADAVINARKTYKKIGVIAPFFTQPSFMERLRGIERVLTAQHFELVMYSIDTQEDLTNYLTALVTANRVDGLIFLCIHLNQDLLELVRTAQFPVCFVEDQVDGFNSVVVKNLEGGQKAAEYLYSIGCRKPGFVGEKSALQFAVQATEDRFRGFKFFFANHGILIENKHVWLSEFTEQTLDGGIRNFLAQDDLPDCVFCSSDLIAARFISLAREKGVAVPEQIKVIGFDNIDVAQYIGLSSVSQNLDESGRIAAEIIISKIKEPSEVVIITQLTSTIIERESSGIYAGVK